MLKELFAPYGEVNTITQKDNPKGKFAFLNFVEAADGASCAYNAVEGLDGKDLGAPSHMKLFVKAALTQQQRSAQFMREKNASKRCTLYVKNFDPLITEESLTQIFRQYGDIESIKLFPDGVQQKTYSFVSFKTPEQAQNAL